MFVKGKKFKVKKSVGKGALNRQLGGKIFIAEEYWDKYWNEYTLETGEFWDKLREYEKENDVFLKGN